MSQYAAELCELVIKETFGELYSHLVYHFTSVDDGATYYTANWRAAYLLVRSSRILRLIEERLGRFAARVVSTIISLGHTNISYLETLSFDEPAEESNEDVDADAYADADADADVDMNVDTNGMNGAHRLENGNGTHAEAHTGDAADMLHQNDAEDAQESTITRLHFVLRELAAYGFIMRIKDVHLQNPADLLESAARTVKASGELGDIKGKKLEEKVHERAQELVTEWTDGLILRGVVPRTIKRASKRSLDDDPSEGHRKRAKLEGGLYGIGTAEGEDDSDEDDYYDDNDVRLDVSAVTSQLHLARESHMSKLVIGINYEKLDVALRNQRLVELADQQTSSATSEIYEKLLSRVELKTSKCRQQIEPVLEGEEGEHYSTPISLHTIVGDLNPDLNLTDSIAGIADKPTHRALGNGAAYHEKDEDDDEDDDDGEEDGNDEANSKSKSQSRIYQVSQHLTLLASEPYHFSTRRMESGMITWTVEWRNLARKLRRLEIERFVASKFGNVAVRIIRVLAKKGKLDEKRLQEISLLPSKDLRQILARLQAAGFIDLQEVPRDAQRQPSRTIYLWFYDPDRVTMMLIEDLYKCISRCFQRLAHERRKLKFLIEKAERSDVKRDMERYLGAADRATLADWKTKEALTLAEISKLDDLVAVLRDY
ncbi:RNA polymerase III subunit C82 [Myotisia sp. PD_48]|nr:RNA polymerase III subunit C82 [Myotisia sp. PD_48]